MHIGSGGTKFSMSVCVFIDEICHFLFYFNLKQQILKYILPTISPKNAGAGTDTAHRRKSWGMGIGPQYKPPKCNHVGIGQCFHTRHVDHYQ